jgi:ATP-dependent RNA helicase DeaD
VDAAPVIARGHNVAALIPPVPEAALPYLLAIADRRTLVLTPDASRAVALADALVAAGRDAAGIVAVSGLARAARRLAPGMPVFALAGVEDAAALLRRSALKAAEAQTLVLAWPEELDEEGAAALEAVLAECDKEAQRLLFASTPGPAVDTLMERYAWKAMTFDFPAVDAFPPTPIGPARVVVRAAAQFADARRAVLDAVNPADEDTLVIAPCPASREEAEALAARAPADAPPVFVVQACQLPWLRRHFRPLTVLRLPAAADLAERRAERLRATLAALIEAGDLDKDLLALSPLFDRYDPADVAAAAVRAAASGALGKPGATAAATSAAAPVGGGDAVPTWAKLWVGVGKKDGIRPGDLVGAIIGETKIAADRVGKIDIRELYSIVEVRGDEAERVVSGLTGATMRGRRLTARIDRGHGPGGARPPHRP